MVRHLETGRVPLGGCMTACGMHEVYCDNADTYTKDGDEVTCGACRAWMAGEVEDALDKPNAMDVATGRALDLIAGTWGRTREPGETDTALRKRLARDLRKTRA